MFTNIEVANVLKQLRESKGLTQAGLAEILGKSQQTIAAWEKGRAQPDLNTLFFLICDVYETTINEAFGMNDTNPLTLEETTLLNEYRQLNDSGKETIKFAMELEKNRRR